MKFSFEWLKSLSSYNGSAKEMAELLSKYTAEADVDLPKAFDKIIVARVVKVDKHPNADRLRVVELTDGENTIAPVVCGAWNFDVSAMVALALPGATIPHNQHDPEGKPFVLSKATIRGVESQGMICSGKELGLSDDGSGIMLLGSSYKVGEPFAPKKNGGTVLDVTVPANRPDLISYRGIAREIAALANGKLAVPVARIKLESYKPRLLKVSISDTKLCPRYTALRMNNVEVGPSPEFIKKRLIDSGLRPINNVVDITNYVMLETGQPLHAFDADSVATGIVVRKAFVNETLTTLDDQKRTLNTDMLVIADAKKAVAVAGVIGGKDSAVTESTREIVLESANFNPASVRRTARNLGLRTDASLRFEKNLPLSFTKTALGYAAELLSEHAGAQILEYAEAGQGIPAAKQIVADAGDINNFLGTKISPAEQKKILNKLGFKTTGTTNLKITIPEYRNDVTNWQDTAEEVARIYGLDKIPDQPIRIISSSHMTDAMHVAKEKTADLLVGLGFDQIYTYSFISGNDADKWEIPHKILIEVANPLSHDQQFLRPNLIINGLKILEHNSKTAEHGSYFEVGNIYWKEGKDIEERTYLSILAFDRRRIPSEVIVGGLMEFFRRLNVDAEIIQESEQMAQVKTSGKIIGRIASLPVSDLPWLGVHLELEPIQKLMKEPKFEQFTKYPSVSLDVAVLVRKDLPWQQLENLVRKQSKLIVSTELLDIYEGKNISPNRKSLAFRVVYQAPDRTLTDKEVEKVHAKLLEELKNKFSAQIRD